MAMNEAEALQAIKDKEIEFGKLYERMDKDADLAKRKKYVMVDDQGKRIPNCDHVTLPKAAIFSNRANAITTAANQQIIVSGAGLKDDKTSKIETFYRNCYTIADDLLRLRNMPPAFTFHSHNVNTRGRIGQRVIVEIDEEGKLKVDIVPMDYRFASYDFDDTGLAWHSYKTTRSRSAIEATYEIGVKGKTGEVRDYWSREANYVYVDGEVVLSEANPNDEVPVAMSYSPAGLMFLDDDVEENRGESIFWLNRNMYAEANKIISVIQTLNSGALFPPLQKEYEEIPNEKPPSPLGGSRTIVPVKKGEMYHPMPREDVYQATKMAWSIVDSHIQQGSFSTIEFGTLQFPLSAVALENLAEGRELVLAPGLQSLSEMYLETCNKIKRQFVKLGKTVELKGKGKSASYSPSDIDIDCDISFRYFTGSRKYALAGISEAQAIGSLVSDDYKRRELIKIENPDEEASKLDAQTAEEMHPELKIYNQIKGFIDGERWAEAWMAYLKLQKIMLAEYAPQETQAPKEKQPQGGQIPLFSGSPSKVSGRQPGGIAPNQEANNAESMAVE